MCNPLSGRWERCGICLRGSKWSEKGVSLQSIPMKNFCLDIAVSSWKLYLQKQAYRESRATPCPVITCEILLAGATWCWWGPVIHPSAHSCMCHWLLISVKSWPYPSRICHPFNCSRNYLLNVFEHLQRRQLAASGQVKQAGSFMAGSPAVISWGVGLSILFPATTEREHWWKAEAGQRAADEGLLPL